MKSSPTECYDLQEVRVRLQELKFMTRCTGAPGARFARSDVPDTTRVKPLVDPCRNQIPFDWDRRVYRLSSRPSYLHRPRCRNRPQSNGGTLALRYSRRYRRHLDNISLPVKPTVLKDPHCHPSVSGLFCHTSLKQRCRLQTAHEMVRSSRKQWWKNLRAGTLLSCLLPICPLPAR